jgi:putative ABC transport system permease protein
VGFRRHLGHGNSGSDRGLLLAFSGTSAVVSFLVTQRTREFGIRMALGATVQRLVASVVGSLLGVTAIAGGAGVVAAAGLAHLAQGTLEMTPAFGPIPYIGGMLVVVSASVVAALLPSLRTARINPVAALRAE